MDQPDKQQDYVPELTNAQLNRDQMIDFLKNSLARSQRYSYELTQAAKLLTNCAGNLAKECKLLNGKIVELYGELDDQDRELDDLYGLTPDDRNL